jgi:Cof subfamily protein (haloacid dehalogenase superfamily)
MFLFHLPPIGIFGLVDFAMVMIYSRAPIVFAFLLATGTPRLFTVSFVIQDALLLPTPRPLPRRFAVKDSVNRDELHHDESKGDPVLFESDDALSNTKINQPSKSDIYSNEELLGLLNMHESLSQSIPDFLNADETVVIEQANRVAPSLQEMIVQTVQEIEKESTVDSSTNTLSIDRKLNSLKFQSSFSVPELERILPRIRAIASDVDGTLLGSDHTLHPITEQAIINAVEASYSPMHPLQYFFPATGKTRPGALGSLGPKMKALLQQSPGVYVQGLYCVDASGSVVFEKKLSRIAVEQAERLATQCNITLIAYDGDVLYVTPSAHRWHVDEVSSRWGEPPPVPLDGLVSEYQPCFHKILFMGDDADTIRNDIRPQLEALAASLDCVVTQAIPTMLELLPGGCSKALGVQKLCEALGLDLATEVVAIGDAENDLDMVRKAAVGIAVGNAVPSVKNVADVVMDDTNDDGAAGQAIELFGLRKVVELLTKE